MPWAGRLWFVTYVAHKAKSGSGTGIFSVDDELNISKHEESRVGTYANLRLINTDDLWNVGGNPAGWGGPWWKSRIEAGVPSDPFLSNGFREKCLHLCHAGPDSALRVSIELDIGGNGNWQVYKDITTVNGYACHVFPPGLSAHWVRLLPHQTTTATAQFFYS